MVEKHVRDKRSTLLVSFVSYKKQNVVKTVPLNKGSMGLGPELIKAKAIITDL